jgi:hypothetical protein
MINEAADLFQIILKLIWNIIRARAWVFGT